MRAFFKYLCLSLLGLSLQFGWLQIAQSQTVFTATKPFSIAYQTSAPGDIVIIGNTMMTCSLTDLKCADARNGVANPPASNNNNAYVMANVNVDSQPAPPGVGAIASSSTAGLTIPPGASVLWAGLYWGAVSGNAARTQVRLKTPLGTYLPVTANWIAELGGAASKYQAAATVTAIVSAGGSGNYTLADLRTTVSGKYGGWALVVVYQLNTAPFRNLTVFDGFLDVPLNGTLDIPVGPFLAPTSVANTAKVGLVAYEGDFGVSNDAMLLNGVSLSNSVNPANNIFNSSISGPSGALTDKTPNYVNQLGFDIDVFQAPVGAIGSGATSAVVRMNSGADPGTAEAYIPGVITTAIDIYVPNLSASLTKTVVDLNGGVLNPDDVLEYSISFKNTGQDAATKVFVVDPIPLGTTYVPGSLKIAAGANAGVKTDAATDDQAEFDSALNRVLFRLGTGANSATGGSFAPNAGTTITFQVKVNPGTSGQLINNTATLSYSGATLTTTFVASASVGIAVANLPKLTHQKTVQVLSDPVNGTINPKNIPGAVNLYTLTIQNTGSGTANSLTIADLISTNSELFTGNFLTGTGTGSPFLFISSTTPASGQSCGFVAIGDATDCVEFSKDSGATWTYTPNGAYDPVVTNIRFRLAGTMNGALTPGTPPYPSFSLQFKTRIK
jgi:uncharacterized repeat protein (TIGR01451 family)